MFWIFCTNITFYALFSHLATLNSVRKKEIDTHVINIEKNLPKFTKIILVFSVSGGIYIFMTNYNAFLVGFSRETYY